MTRGRLVGLAAAALVVGAALSGCSGNAGTSTLVPDASSAGAASAATPSAVPATIAFSQPSGASDVNPRTPLEVRSTGGLLSEVVMTDGAGATVAGAFASDRLSWTSAQPLKYATTYTVTAKAGNDAGAAAAQTLRFQTVRPRLLTMPYIDTAGGSALTDGAPYGVGMVAAVHFDEAVDPAKAERALQVRTSPPVDGSWYWLDDQTAHWRPKDYYRPGTTVTVTANVYGAELGDRLYGQSDASKTFTIGAKHVSIADDLTHQVSVFFDDQLVRTMPTSMGRGGSVTEKGRTISFWTQPGTYTVLDKANPVLMDSSSYGLPVNSKLGYKENIYWATRISTDGVYLHQLNSTVWAQGNTDTSHGCLNLNEDNARWFYQNAQVGDVVQVVNTGGQPLAVWQGGDWTLPWDQWQAGSALH